MKIKKILLLTLVGLAAISILFIIYSSKTQKVSIISTSPQDKQTNIILTSDINIAFNKTLTEKEKEKISYKILPETEADHTWLVNSLKIIPNESLKPATKYAVEAYFDQSRVSFFSFETTLLTNEQSQREGSLQIKDDYLFGETYKKFLADYPWYQNLPIDKANYRIVYDFKQKSFRIRLKAVFEKVLRETVIKEAVVDIKSLGVKDPIKYYVLNLNEITPEP